MSDAPRRRLRERLARPVRVVRRGFLVAHALAVAVVALRIGLRDLFAFSEWLYYVPAIFVLVPAILTAIPAGGGWRARMGIAAVLLVATISTVAVEQPRLVPLLVRDPAPLVGRQIRIVAWNVMSYNKGEEPVIAGFKEDDPDVVCLLEGTFRRGAPGFLRRGMGPGYEWIGTRQMAMGSRLPVLEAEELTCRTRLRVFRARFDVGGQALTVLLVDVPSPPRADTADVYGELAELAGRETGPLVMVGDFNTPRGSWHMKRAAAGMRDFYTSAPGNAWLASWPSGMQNFEVAAPGAHWLLQRWPEHWPLYQIDHAFCSASLVPFAADLRGPDGSDHYRQSIAFVLPEE